MVIKKKTDEKDFLKYAWCNTCKVLFWVCLVTVVAWFLIFPIFNILLCSGFSLFSIEFEILDRFLFYVKLFFTAPFNLFDTIEGIVAASIVGAVLVVSGLVYFVLRSEYNEPILPELWKEIKEIF